MLSQLDLSRKLSKDEYNDLMDQLEIKLGRLQRASIQDKIPVVVVFEGWDAAGKGTLINQLILALDPRHFSVYSGGSVNSEEMRRPFLWRFWVKTPARGRMTIYDRSWYTRVLSERVEKVVDPAVWQRAYGEINAFERQLANDGTVIIKFFLHISKKKQEKRFKKLEENPSTRWRVTKTDWKHHRNYDQYATAAEEMIVKTDSGYAPWTIIEAHDRRFATVKIYKTVIMALERAHQQGISETAGTGEEAGDEKNVVPSPVVQQVDAMTYPSILDRVDLSLKLERDDYRRQLKVYQKKIRNLEHEVYVNRLPVVVVYEGWDAAGKGGNIKRLTRKMDPRGYEVLPIAAPNDIERLHHYLWRFWMRLPKTGHIAIFDRSWYGRVMVERVEEFATETEWRRAYREINAFEEQLTNFGTILIKFWLHIDPEMQLQRFEERREIPYKRWKLTDEDWRNREKWDIYKAAVDEMLFRTSTPYAPWTILESNSKHYARIKALKTVIAAIEKRLNNL